MDAGSNASESYILGRGSVTSSIEGDHVIDPSSLTIAGTIGIGRYSTTLQGSWIDRACAIRKIRLLSADYLSAEDVATFKLEAEQIFALPQHPHLTTTYGVSQLGPQLCFVDEFVDGIPLDMLLHKQMLSLRTKLRFIRQLASSLSYLHQHSIRYCKTFVPHNILVCGFFCYF
jgi:serine/threonine protein kinase